MSNYWAIAIGINQYQQFNPLLYAQWDAQALWTYWMREGGIPKPQCMLLTDSGALPKITSEQKASTYPNKQNIQQQLIELGHHRLTAGDTLWCFFSGYGLNHNGQDYLMPIDGNPNDVAQTGISAESFFSTLKAFPTDRILVLLDLKRSPETINADNQTPTSRLGDDIAKQAEQTGIATILASQPDQLSHETLALRQGLFTATLLEGLRTHGCFQLGQLTQYLDYRLPELSEYHFRPRQAPLVIVPATQRRHVLLAPLTRQPAMAGLRSGASTHETALLSPPLADLLETPPLAPSSSSAPSAQEGTVIKERGTEKEAPLNVPELPFSSDVPIQTTGLAETVGLAGDVATSPHLSQRPGVKLPILSQQLAYTPEPLTTPVNTILPPNLNPPRPTPAPAPAAPDSNRPERLPAPIPRVKAPEAGKNDAVLTQRLKYGIPLFATLMMLGVLWFNWPALIKQRLANAPNGDLSSPIPTNSEGQSNNGDSPDAGGGNGAIAPPKTSSPISTENTGNAANTSDPTVEPVNGEANESSNNGLFPNLFGSNSADDSSGDAFVQAKASIEAGDYKDAERWLNQVPSEAQTREYEQLRTQVNEGLGQSDQESRDILNQAIASLNEVREETRVNQASDFGRAIAIANQINSEDPLYEEAQGYISRWGEVILDLAKSRAQSGEYEKAIATVNLIEPALPLLYPKAQRLLAEWQQTTGVYNSSRSIIDAAKADILKFPNQSFPYNRGIGKLREIEPDDLLHGEAQELIDEWSQQILAIAANRARQGDIQHAIDTARYVPQDTVAYPDALQAIEEWSQ